MDKRTIILFTLPLLMLHGCFNRGNKDQKKQDVFYTVLGGWDWIRVPLLKPYEVIKVDPKIEINTWVVVLHDTITNLDNIGNIKRVSVVDSTIFILSGGDKDSTYFNGEKVSIALHLLDVKRKIEKGFTNQDKFNKYIKTNRYPLPKWYNIDSLSDALSNGGKLPWMPKQ